MTAELVPLARAETPGAPPIVYALTPAEDEVLRAIANTIRELAHQGYHWGYGGGCTDEARDKVRGEMYKLADTVQSGRLNDWACCPICEEQECDAGCPLETIRAACAASTTPEC